MKLQIKFFSFFVFTSLFSLILVVLILSNQLDGNLTQRMGVDLEDSAKHVSVSLEGLINDIFLDTTRLSSLISFQDNNSQILDILKEERRINWYYDDISVINREGVVVTSTSYNYRGAWETKKGFLDAINMKTSVSDAHLMAAPKKLIFSVLAPVINSTNGVENVLATQIDMKIIWDVVDKLKLGNTGYFYIVNSDNTILSHPNKSMIFESSESKYLGCDSGFDIFEFNENKYIVGHAPFLKDEFYQNGGCWQVIALKEKKETDKLIGLINLIIVISFLITLPIVIIISIILSRSISKPIVLLSRLIDRISMGDLNVKIDPKLKNLKDEMGDLARSFDRVLVSLKLAMKRK